MAPGMRDEVVCSESALCGALLHLVHTPRGALLHLVHTPYGALLHLVHTPRGALLHMVHTTGGARLLHVVGVAPPLPPHPLGGWVRTQRHLAYIGRFLETGFLK